jgi:hypothetical protein
MDSSNIFVLLISAVAIGILVYLELKSRRKRTEEQSEKRE